MKSFVSKALDKSWFYPLVLLLIGLVAYGFIFTKPGFYWDDWESVFLYYLHQPAISFFYFASRPFSALPYVVLFPIVKMTPFIWQLILILIRWAGICFIYFTLTALWPERTWLHKWIGVLLFVFPGFYDQPVSVAFTRQLSAFLLFSVSIFLTALAITDRKRFWLWMPFSVITGLTHIFMIEYYVGLEIIRPVIIWSALQSGNKGTNRIYWKTLLLWLPFLIGLGFYLWWRLVFLPTTMGGDPNDPVLLRTIFISPLDNLNNLVQKMYQDIGYLLTSVWSAAFAYDKLNIFSSKIARIAWFMGIATAITFAFSIHKNYKEESSTKDQFFLIMLLLGSLIFIGGALPIWATDRQILAGKWSDRFALAPMLGAVILVVCSLNWLLRTRNQKEWFFSILVASSISLQIYNVNNFRLDWGNQLNIYWQLHWRVPSLEPGTALFGNGTFTDKSSYYEGIYIVNLIFDSAPRQDPRYGYFDIYHAGFSDFVPGIPLIGTNRGVPFKGNTSQALAFDFSEPGGCVRVLDPIYQGDPMISSGVADLFDISDVSNIKPTPDLPLNYNIFGAELPHTWCYFFEKADLARQMQDWNIILQLKADTDSLGYQPGVAAEDLPFIEAYAHTNQWEQAYQLSLDAYAIGSGPGMALCNAWLSFEQLDQNEEMLSYTEKAHQDFCPLGNP